MKIAIVFDSKTGNTELVAGAIREACAGQEIVAFGPPPADVPQADLVFVGSWVDKGTCTSPMSQFNQSLAGKRVAVFGTAGFGGDAAYAAKLFERARASLPQEAQVIGYFYCLGKMRLESREKYVALLREHPEDKQLQVSVKNFDEAQSHPDANDLARAAAFARDMMAHTN